jgi:hypothetical protein
VLYFFSSFLVRYTRYTFNEIIINTAMVMCTRYNLHVYPEFLNEEFGWVYSVCLKPITFY